MKKLLGIVVLCFILNSCGDGYSGSDYDKGYDDGYEDGEFDGDCDYYKQNNMWDKYKGLKCG